MDIQKVQYEKFSRTEKACALQECATMAPFIKAQQEVDVRRFKALQEQQSSTTKMFVTFMNNVFRELRPGQATSASGIIHTHLQHAPTNQTVQHHLPWGLQQERGPL